MSRKSKITQTTSQSPLQEQQIQQPVAQLSDISNLAYQTQIAEISRELQEKEEEILRLENMIRNLSVPEGGVTRIILSDMEIICMKQIANLKSLSMARDLTLDEVKRLDLLNKNLRLAQSEPTTIEGGTKPLPKDITSEQLMQIASKKIEE